MNRRGQQYRRINNNRDWIEAWQCGGMDDDTQESTADLHLVFARAGHFHFAHAGDDAARYHGAAREKLTAALARFISQQTGLKEVTLLVNAYGRATAMTPRSIQPFGQDDAYAY